MFLLPFPMAAGAAGRVERSLRAPAALPVLAGRTGMCRQDGVRWHTQMRSAAGDGVAELCLSVCPPAAAFAAVCKEDAMMGLY